MTSVDRLPVERRFRGIARELERVPSVSFSDLSGYLLGGAEREWVSAWNLRLPGGCCEDGDREHDSWFLWIWSGNFDRRRGRLLHVHLLSADRCQGLCSPFLSFFPCHCGFAFWPLASLELLLILADFVCLLVFFPPS